MIEIFGKYHCKNILSKINFRSHLFKDHPNVVNTIFFKNNIIFTKKNRNFIKIIIGIYFKCNWPLILFNGLESSFSVFGNYQKHFPIFKLFAMCMDTKRITMFNCLQILQTSFSKMFLCGNASF